MSLQSKNDIAPFKKEAVPKNLSYHQANTKEDPLLNRIDLRSKFALENAGVGIWEWDISTDELIWSSVMFTLYGYDSHQEN
jgi:PAS domain-containing protein